MAAEDIGANFSNYVGNAGAASGNFGVIEADTRPLNQLAAYTMLYQKNVWEKNKQETDAKIKGLADLSDIALNNLRGKDKDEVAKDYNDLIQYASEYARKIPKNQQERLQNELEWQTRYGGFKNKYNSGKGRAVTYLKRYNDIMGSDKEADTKEKEISFLNQEFDKTGIETPISGVANFKVSVAPIPEPTTQKAKSIIIGDNKNVTVEFGYYNPKTNAGTADATALGIRKLYPKEGTKEYEMLSDLEKNQAQVQSTIDSDAKVWVDAVEPLNAALKHFVNADGVFDSIGFENANASNTVVMDAYNGLKRYNDYNRKKFDQASGGMFENKGLQIALPENVNPNDFKVGFVEFAKGVNTNQLVQSGMFAKFKGDTATPTVQETDDQIQRDALANALKLKNIDEAGANYRAGLDLIGKGFVRNSKGKWEKQPTGVTSANNGGLVPYWQNYIAPQIDAASLNTTTKEGGVLGFFQSTKKDPLPANYTGDVDVPSNKLSGLGVALAGETNSEGKQKAYDNQSKTKIRFQNGVPTGVVIDDVFYDQNDINSKATRLQDKNVNNKFDTPVFGETVTPEAAPVLSDAQKYLNSLKK